jgi:hypothetical protein
MTVRLRRGAAALALLGALAAGRAEAFVSSRTSDGHYFYWRESCVPVTIYLNRFPMKGGMTPDQIVKSVTAAAHAWSGDAITCTDGSSPYLEIVPSLAADSAAPPPVAWDARNTVIFRTDPDSWSKSGTSDHLYDSSALAVTTVTARSDGHIVDVDMEVNGVGMSWMNLDPGVTLPFDQGDTTRIFDLQNALTHEFGHFIGLDHTCFIPSATNPAVGTDGKLRPTDDGGNAVPDCDAATSEVANTVMFNVTHSGETSKRVLSSDDIRAACTIYAPANAHEACALDSASPGCAVGAVRAGRRAPRGWALGVASVSLVLASIVAARRRARRG